LQVFLEAGHTSGKASKGCEKEEESNEEFKRKTKVGLLILLLSTYYKRNQDRLSSIVSKETTIP